MWTTTACGAVRRTTARAEGSTSASSARLQHWTSTPVEPLCPCSDYSVVTTTGDGLARPLDPLKTSRRNKLYKPRVKRPSYKECCPSILLTVGSQTRTTASLLLAIQCKHLQKSNLIPNPNKQWHCIVDWWEVAGICCMCEAAQEHQD